MTGNDGWITEINLLFSTTASAESAVIMCASTISNHGHVHNGARIYGFFAVCNVNFCIPRKCPARFA